MFLIDTNVISEARKKTANPGVISFFQLAQKNNHQVFISVITLGELRRGVEMIRHRNDFHQAEILKTWLEKITHEYSGNILSFTSDEAQVWGKLRVPNPENSIDKQIAATALVYDLTIVTRNIEDFNNLGVKLLNPFSE